MSAKREEQPEVCCNYVSVSHTTYTSYIHRILDTPFPFSVNTIPHPVFDSNDTCHGDMDRSRPLRKYTSREGDMSSRQLN
jgi:hypothetical protein